MLLKMSVDRIRAERGVCSMKLVSTLISPARPFSLLCNLFKVQIKRYGKMGTEPFSMCFLNEKQSFSVLLFGMSTQL